MAFTVVPFALDCARYVSESMCGATVTIVATRQTDHGPRVVEFIVDGEEFNGEFWYESGRIYGEW